MSTKGIRKSVKEWGVSEFWGLGDEFEPDWELNDAQIWLRFELIELCRRKIRPLAIKSDATYEYPRESLKALSSQGLIGLLIPTEFGGLGESHACAVMVVETLARYGCPSTAMIYAMHLQATAILLFRYHDNDEIKNLLRRINKETLIGTSSYSDPATGGHFWFPLSSKAQKMDEDHFRIFRFNSWTTGAGFADFYVFQTPNPDVGRDHSNLVGFFAWKDEVRASTDNWSAMGLHGNQSGPLLFDGVLHKSRMIGNPGDGRKSNDEVGAIFFLLSTSAVWNGISMGCIDLAKKHTKQKTHGDLGMRVCDYPIIQDYVGRCVSETNCCRAFHLMLASQLDKMTNSNDWTLHKNPDFAPRSAFVLWLMQSKHNASENASRVSDQMLKACGGDGYKSDLGLERLVRDAKAGCLMAPTNEVIRNLIGKGSLIGLHSLDMWDKHTNEQSIHHEINKMTLEEKKELLKTLSADVEKEESSKPINHVYQDKDFENPFNTAPPTPVKSIRTPTKELHPALKTEEWTSLKLISREDKNSTMTSFVFGLPGDDFHSGCLPGQYIQVRILSEGKYHERYFSLASPPQSMPSLEIVLKFETHGIVSNFFKSLKIGNTVDFRGPCGGFEFESKNLDYLTLISSGTGLAPGLQMIRSLALDPEGKTNITLIHYATTSEELLYHDELKSYPREDPRIRCTFTVGEPPKNWMYEIGYIDLEMLKKYVPVVNEETHKVVLCGGPSMTISCLHSLRSLKVPSQNIFIYGQFGTEQMRSVYGRNVKLSGHTCDGVV